MKSTDYKPDKKGQRLMCRKLNGHLPARYYFLVCVCSIFIVQDMAPRTGDVDHPLISIDHPHTYTCYIIRKESKQNTSQKQETKGTKKADVP
jgi:hypothetical protein